MNKTTHLWPQNIIFVETIVIRKHLKSCQKDVFKKACFVFFGPYSKRLLLCFWGFTCTLNSSNYFSMDYTGMLGNVKLKKTLFGMFHFCTRFWKYKICQETSWMMASFFSLKSDPSDLRTQTQNGAIGSTSLMSMEAESFLTLKWEPI